MKTIKSKKVFLLVLSMLILLTLASQCPALFPKEVEAEAKAFDPDKDEALVAWFSFEGDLSEKTGKFEAAKVIGDKIGKTPKEEKVSFVEGISGKAVYLDGERGISLPEDLVKGYSYTISFWMKADVFTPWTPVFFGAYDVSNWISIPPYHPGVKGGSYLLWSFSGYWYDGILDVSFEPGTWYHVAVVVRRGDAAVYVNGKYTLSKIQINGMEDPTGKIADIFSRKPGGIFTLGVNWWDQPYKGAIDELRIYSRALTKNEIKILYERR